MVFKNCLANEKSDDVIEESLLNMLRDNMQPLRNKKNKLEQMDTGLGVAYTRWGRRECPDGVSLVYKGFVAASRYSSVGGGANYLCLPDEDPVYVGTGTPSYKSYLYGTEYEFAGSGPLHNLNNFDAPCAVCHARDRTSEIMIPARINCPETWHHEYTGYLVAEYYSAANAVYVCLDHDAEAIPGSSANTNPAGFYNVLNTCTAIKCPPYKNNGILTCVVCTK
jgi:hypothetical protein